MAFYISLSYLKMMHYTFFFFALLSLVFGIVFFDVFLTESMALMFLFVFYFVLSLVTAHFFYQSYKETADALMIITQHSKYYILIAFTTLFSVFLIISFYPDLLGFFYSVYFINYYYFFIVIIGFGLSRFHIISRLFRVYGLLTMKRALGIARKHAKTPELKGYKIGDDPEIDQLLDRVVTKSNYPKPTVRQIEIRILEKRVKELEDYAEYLLSRSSLSVPETRHLLTIKRQIKYSRGKLNELMESPL
jgi:hypothetical protein